MRSTGRVTALATAFLLVAAVTGLEAASGAAGLDREVVVVGEDLVVLSTPPPAGWAVVELPELDLTLPVPVRDAPRATAAAGPDRAERPAGARPYGGKRCLSSSSPAAR